MFKRVLVAIVLISMLVGCGGGQDVPDQSEPQQEYAPVKGGTLRIYSYNADTLNPIFTKNNANSNMLKLIFEPLVYCGNDMKPIPILADSWSVSDDGLIWTIHIREGVKFHDKSPLTAEDVVSSLIIAQDKNSIYHTNLADVQKITSSGNTVIIRLSKPKVNFINLLEIPVIKASSKPIIEDFYPNGTGAYVYQPQQDSKKILLSANRDWWTNSTQYIDNIEVNILPDKNTASFAFDTKEIDVVTMDTVSAGKYIGSKDNNVFFYDTSNLIFLGFNNQNKLFSNPQMRKAVAYAINKNKMKEQVLLSNGNVTDTFINPVWYMYDDQTEKYEYDIDKTKSVLAQEGFYNKAPHFELLVCQDDDMKNNLADFLEQALEYAGFSVDVKKVGWDEYINLINRQAYDAFIGEFLFSANIDPSYLLSSDSKSNYFKYKSSDMDMLINSWKLAVTEDDQIRGYHDIQKLYAQDLPFISLYYKQSALLLNKRVKGKIDPVCNNMFYNINKWYIDEKGIDKKS